MASPPTRGNTSTKSGVSPRRFAIRRGRSSPRSASRRRSGGWRRAAPPAPPPKSGRPPAPSPTRSPADWVLLAAITDCRLQTEDSRSVDWRLSIGIPERDSRGPITIRKSAFRESAFTNLQSSLLHLVVEHDRVVLLRRHRPLDQRPHPLVLGRRDPLLAKLLALELQLEAVVMRGRRRALDDAAALEHLHADVAVVLDGFGHERAVEGGEHLALAPGRDVHFHVEPDVFRLRRRRCGQPVDAKRGGRRDERGPQNASSVHVASQSLPRGRRSLASHVSAARRSVTASSPPRPWRRPSRTIRAGRNRCR